MKTQNRVNKYPVLTVAMMNTLFMELLNRKQQIANFVGVNLVKVEPSRQAQLLQALAMCLHADPLLEKCESAIAYLEAPAADETPVNSEPVAESKEAAEDKEAPDELAEAIGTIFSGLAGLTVNLVEGVCEALAEEFGVSIEAVPPFLVQTNSYMLGFIGKMFDSAEAQLEEGAITNLVSIPEMSSRLEAAVAAYEDLHSRLAEVELSEVSVEQQVRFLFVTALVQLGASLLSQASPAAEYLCQEDDKVTVDASISRAIVRQYGVKEAAVAPFLHGVNSLILPWIEELVQEASAVCETTDSQ